MSKTDKQFKGETEEDAVTDSFQRVDADHPLDLYIGRDSSARYSLLLISQNEPGEIFSSRCITVSVGHRKDGRWALTFSLSDEKYMDIFRHFCDDIISSSREISNISQGMGFVCERYDRWQEMLRKGQSGILSEAEIKGLTGELLFLKKFLFPKYGMDEALNSWIGPERADQDFVCPDKWYEIKTTTSGSESVRISSVEQLDSRDPGELVLIYLDKTSPADPNCVSLNKLVTDIENLLVSFEQRRRFQNVLLEQSYVPQKEYDRYVYCLNGYSRYTVGPSFLSLRRKDLPDSVVNASYRLSVSAIAEFLIEQGE